MADFLFAYSMDVDEAREGDRKKWPFILSAYPYYIV